MARKSAEQAIEPVSPETPAPQGLPLFYKNPVLLDQVRHKDAAVMPQLHYAFAKHTNSLALNITEFVEAEKFYPIVFTENENPMPIAILGLEQDNYFLEKNGNWKADYYIPAYARQYPFIFFEQPDDQKFYLCIDEGSNHYKAEPEPGALALFNKDGTPSETTNNALQFCSAYYQEHVVTRSFCADLKKHKLLVPNRWEMQLPTGKKLSLAQFLVIDEKALSELPDEVVLDFHKKGWLGLIYVALSSSANWKRLAGVATKTN